MRVRFRLRRGPERLRAEQPGLALHGATADCASGDQKSCRLPEGYCTSSGCTTNADCSKDADYACATDAGGSYCKRPPLNQGKACSTQGVDPTCGSEATVCALGACAVYGCSVDSRLLAEPQVL